METREMHELHIKLAVAPWFEVENPDALHKIGIALAEPHAKERGWKLVDVRLITREPWTEPIGDMQPPKAHEEDMLTFLATFSA